MILDILAILIIVVVALGFIVPILRAVFVGLKKKANESDRMIAIIILIIAALTAVLMSFFWAINRLAG